MTDSDDSDVDGKANPKGIHGWKHAVGARKLNSGLIEVMILWENGDCTFEACAEDYWRARDRADLLSFVAKQQPILLHTGNNRSNGTLDACHNGVHRIRFQYLSDKRGERGETKHRYEVHDLLNLGVLSSWVFVEFHKSFKELASK